MLTAWTASGVSSPIASGLNQAVPTVTTLIGYGVIFTQTGQYWADFPGTNYSTPNFQSLAQIAPLQHQTPNAATQLMRLQLRTPSSGNS